MPLLLALLNTVLVIAVAWCTVALYWSALPRWWLRAALAASYASVSLGALAVLPDYWLAVAWNAAAVGTLVACWALVPLWTERRYSPEATTLASATFEGDRVTVHSVRDFTYRSPTDFDIRYEDRTYDLGAVQTVDFVVSYFGGKAVAHTFLSFGFADGRYVAVSIEARRLHGEVFKAKKALFKRYELMYVWGDERDLIGLRTNYRGEQVYLYPTMASPTAARRLLVDMLEQTNELVRKPVFYSVLRRNCTTMIVRHLNQILLHRDAYTRRVLMTGYADHYAHQDGLLAIEGSFETAKRRAHIDERARAAGRDADFSRRIRTHIPGR